MSKNSTLDRLRAELAIALVFNPKGAGRIARLIKQKGVNNVTNI